MNKKRFITLAGVLATVFAIGSSALACHLFEKKSSESKDSDKKNKENQNVIKEEKEKKEYIEIRTMYGIPMNEDLKPQSGDTKTDEDIILIEKYAIPFNPDKDIRVLKYAVPKEIRKPETNVKKYAIPSNPAVAKYALPQYMNDDNIEKYAVPNIDDMPVLKYATPYFPPEETNK